MQQSTTKTFLRKIANARQKERKSFVAQIHSCMKTRCSITRFCGFKPVEPLLMLDELLDGIVDVDQADEEMFDYYRKNKTLVGFLETRKWLTASAIDKRLGKIRRAKFDAAKEARSIIKQHNLTKEDIFPEFSKI